MMTSFTSGCLVSITSLRLFSGSSTGTIPACANSGRPSSRMRPLDNAMLMVVDISAVVPGNRQRRLRLGHRRARAGDTSDARTELRQFLFDHLVAAIDVINAINDGFVLGDQ